MMNLWAILFVCLFGVPLSLGWTPPWGPSPWREAGGLVPRVWGPDCPSPYRQARMSSDPHGCLVPICCRVEQDLSQFQLLTSNWLTTLTSANLLGLRRGSPPPGSVGNPGFPELPLTQPLVPSSCGLGSVATWCHRSLLSIWCTHFWFCPLVVLSIFILLNVDIYWYCTQSSHHRFFGHKVGKHREKWPKGRRNEAEKGKQHDWCYQGRGRKPWQTHLYGWLTDLQDV